MALARFFDRVYASAGRVLSISREHLEQALAQKTVAIICGPECSSEGNDRWAAEFAINLLARLYPSICLRGSSQLCEHLASIAKHINPSVDLRGTTGPTVAGIAIGSTGDTGSEIAHVRADGWVARLHLQQPTGVQRGPPNPYAAGAAATLGTWHVFRRTFAEHIGGGTTRSIDISLLDYGNAAGADRNLPAVDLGRLAFVGLGAVANGAFWAMSRHETLRGSAYLVDPQTIELSNLQRYVLALDSDDGVLKSTLAARALSNTRVSTVPFNESLERFAGDFSSGFDIPTVCISVDNIENRRVAQALLPRLVVNGCTSDSGLGASWHDFNSARACLACLYQPQGQLPSHTDLVANAFGLEKTRAAELILRKLAPTDSEFSRLADHLGLSGTERERWRGKALNELYTDLICGSVQINLKNIAHIEAVPLAHQSALAGILMAAELLKRSDPELQHLAQREQVVQLIDVRLDPPMAGRWSQDRGPEPRCICRDSIYQNAYAKKWRHAQRTPSTA